MAFPVLAAAGVVLAFAVYRYVSGLQKNIAKARKTGFVYLVVRKWQAHPSAAGTCTMQMRAPV
jgi:hypothetical protein